MFHNKFFAPIQSVLSNSYASSLNIAVFFLDARLVDFERAIESFTFICNASTLTYCQFSLVAKLFIESTHVFIFLKQQNLLINCSKEMHDIATVHLRAIASFAANIEAKSSFPDLILANQQKLQLFRVPW